MKQGMILVIAVCAVSAIRSDTAVAESRAAATCHHVEADFTSELATQGCPPGALCAAGRIKHEPLIKGPMFVTITETAASAGLASVPPWMVSVAGKRSLTPHRGGTLSADVIGIAIFDPASGLLAMFDELNLITGGTGRFSGATGTLHVAGRATSPTTFAGEMRGTICVP